MHRIARLSAILVLLPFATAVGLANARAVATTAASSSLSAIDYNFVAQANLGAPFQVDSGQLAEKKAGTAVVRDYAYLMVVSHIPVVDALNTILRRKGINAPANPFSPLTDKAAGGQYEPGSTFKVAVTLAALESGAATPATTVFCPGFLDLGDTCFHCWRPQGHGTLDMRGGIQHSCDVYFYEMARRAKPIDKPTGLCYTPSPAAGAHSSVGRAADS